jgi:hypothetical protein
MYRVCQLSHWLCIFRNCRLSLNFKGFIHKLQRSSYENSATCWKCPILQLYNSFFIFFLSYSFLSQGQKPSWLVNKLHRLPRARFPRAARCKKYMLSRRCGNQSYALSFMLQAVFPASFCSHGLQFAMFAKQRFLLRRQYGPKPLARILLGVTMAHCLPCESSDIAVHSSACSPNQQ